MFERSRPVITVDNCTAKFVHTAFNNRKNLLLTLYVNRFEFVLYFVILILIYFYGNLILSHEFCLIELICYHKHYLRQIKSDLRVNLIYQV